jgi:hypothetical protein
MNGEYHFGMGSGHLSNAAYRIAKRHGATLVNHTEPDGTRRHWFTIANRGEPFNSTTAAMVISVLQMNPKTAREFRESD